LKPTPFLSIITVNKNNITGLHETFNSVIAQVESDFEYIIVDGNSTDGSKDILMGNHLENFKIISEEDDGIYDAMNKGILMANGEFILFLNSGDIFLDSSALKNVISIINSNPQYDLYYADYIQKYSDRESIYALPKKLSLFYFFNYNSINHQSTFIKKSIFNQIGLYETNYKIVSDVSFFINALKAKFRYFHLGDSFVKFDMYGFSSKNHSLRFAEYNQVYKKNLSRFEYILLVIHQKYIIAQWEISTHGLSIKRILSWVQTKKIKA